MSLLLHQQKDIQPQSDHPHHDFRFIYQFNDDKYQPLKNYLDGQAGYTGQKIKKALIWDHLGASELKRDEKLLIRLDKNKVIIEWSNDKDNNVSVILGRLNQLKDGILKVVHG
ncbi:MAG: hypothetical protein ACTHNW_13655 [Mucilaginibacter sp.]